MKIHTQWQRHVEAWRESRLTQADYCRQQSLHPKTFSAWTRRKLLMDKDVPLELIAVQVSPSMSVATAQASVMLRFPHPNALHS